VLWLLPFISFSDLNSKQFRPISKLLFWWFVAGSIYLGRRSSGAVLL